MLNIIRQIEKAILQSLQSNKVIVLLGPRRAGKTVLLKKLIGKIDKPYLFMNGEDVLQLFRVTVAKDSHKNEVV